MVIKNSKLIPSPRKYIAAILAIQLLVMPAFAVSSNDTKKYRVNTQNTIIDLNLNKEINYDYEVYVNSDGSFSLPFKSLAKLLDITAEQNPETKLINFTSPLGIPGIIDYENQKITFGNRVIEFDKSSPTRMIFLEQGLEPETKDEVFVPVNILNDLFETSITADKSNYSISVTTNRPLKAIVEYNENQYPFNKDKNADTAPIITPSPKANVSLDTVNINSQLRLDSTTTKTRDQVYKDSSVNNLAQLGFNGTLLGGDYNINTDIHNGNSPFTFGGMSFKYNKDLKGKTLELGDVTSLNSNELSVGSGLIGMGIGNLKDNEPNYRNISGQVQPGSRINVYINNKFFSTLATQGGYYTLKNLPANNEKVNSIKLEEITRDGQIKTIKEKKYSASPSLVPKGETKYSLITGITGQNNRFFGDNNLNDSYSKKLAGGVKVSRGITDKFTVSAIGAADGIISKPKNNSNDLYINTNNLLFGPYTDANNVSGQTGLLSLNYAPTDSFNINSDLGISRASSSLRNDVFDKNPLGYSSSISANYNKPNYGLSGKLFDYSKGFYLAGSSGLVSDSTNKRGAELSGNLQVKNVALNGGVSKYSAGLNDGLISGKYDFNEYNLSASAPFKDGSNINFNFADRVGKSNLGDASSRSYDVNYTKRLTDRLSLLLSGRSDNFNNEYKASDNNNNYSRYKQLNAKLDYDMPKNLGKLSVMHDIVKATTNSFKDGYNAIRLGYTTPTFKGISAGVSAGYHYTGLNKGFDFSTTLGYEFKSGRKLEVTYSFNRLLGSLVNNIFIPTTSHSSLIFNVFDAVSLIAGGIRSIGFSNPNNGYIEAVTYLDTNQDGIKDPDEPVIPKVPINIEGMQSASTGKKGTYSTKGIPEGIYQVKLDIDKLPGLLALSSGSKDGYSVKVDKKQKTKVFFGLISSIGSISGRVNIKDEFNRKVDIKDLIVTVLNEKGDEIKYTSLDDQGNYYISGLPPGKYSVMLDKNFIDNYQLHPDKASTDVIIKPEYKDYVDIKDINLEYTKM